MTKENSRVSRQIRSSFLVITQTLKVTLKIYISTTDVHSRYSSDEEHSEAHG